MEKQITAAEIHADFYGAEERLFVEAVGLSRGSLITKSDKAERLKKIGFGKAKPIKDNDEREKKRSVSGHLIKAIEHFRTYYPHNKFITETEVEKLCKKYGLVLGETANYTGDMPEKNLAEIEKFKLREEDWKEKSSLGIFSYFMPQTQPETDDWGFFQSASLRSRRNADSLYQEYLSEYMRAKEKMASALGMPSAFARGVDPYDKPKPSKEYEQPAFKICAPKEDFDTRGWELRDGYRLVWDPVVLQPVEKDGILGYLIVTAWGEEASDEIVVNQVNN